MNRNKMADKYSLIEDGDRSQVENLIDTSDSLDSHNNGINSDSIGSKNKDPNSNHIDSQTKSINNNNRDSKTKSINNNNIDSYTKSINNNNIDSYTKSINNNNIHSKTNSINNNNIDVYSKSINSNNIHSKTKSINGNHIDSNSVDSDNINMSTKDTSDNINSNNILDLQQNKTDDQLCVNNNEEKVHSLNDNINCNNYNLSSNCSSLTDFDKYINVFDSKILCTLIGTILYYQKEILNRVYPELFDTSLNKDEKFIDLKSVLETSNKLIYEQIKENIVKNVNFKEQAYSKRNGFISGNNSISQVSDYSLVRNGIEKKKNHSKVKNKLESLGKVLSKKVDCQDKSLPKNKMDCSDTIFPQNNLKCSDKLFPHKLECSDKVFPQNNMECSDTSLPHNKPENVNTHQLHNLNSINNTDLTSLNNLCSVDNLELNKLNDEKCSQLCKTYPSHVYDKTFLFDLDGTLSLVRQKISNTMKNFLKNLSTLANIVIVSGSDYPKIKEQIDDNELLNRFEYIFSENGALVYKNDVLIESRNINKHLGEHNLKSLINFALKYIADLDIPVKRGIFIELRQGMINLCPIGRSCSLSERLEFYEFDKIHRIRDNFIQALNLEFKDLDLFFTLGGQISVDAYPKGWDKSSVLRYLKNRKIYFFGDQTKLGGNDYYLAIHPEINSYTVKSPEHTMEIIKSEFPDFSL